MQPYHRLYGSKRDGVNSIFVENYLMNQNYIGFIELGGLSPEIISNTRVIYTLKKLGHFSLKNSELKNELSDRAEILQEALFT